MLCNRSRTVVKRADPVMGYAGYVVYAGYAGYVEYVGYAPLMNWHSWPAGEGQSSMIHPLSMTSMH